MLKEEAKDDAEDKKEKKKETKKQKKDIKEVKEEEEKQEIFTSEVINAKLKEIVDQRAKRASQVESQIFDLKNLLSHCKDLELNLQILNLLILFEVENSKDAITIVMSRALWLSIFDHISRVISLYSPSLPLPADLDNTRKAIIASLSLRIDRLANELTKAFKVLDPKSSDYALRLSDNISLSKLVNKAINFYEKIADTSNLVRLYIISIYNVHYIHDDLLAEMRKHSKETSKDTFFAVENSEEVVQKLSDIVFKEGDTREQIFTALLVSYHHALHGRYEKAKNLLLQANFSTFSNDLVLQVYLNRCIVQLGLSAFYNGHIKDAFKSLNEIVSSHRLKELLAQTFSISKERSTAQERDDRKRSVPYHMHLNTDIIETVYFICAMLIDTPKMAINPQDPDKYTTSRYFKKLMDFHERQASSGLTEGFREYIIAAAQKLRKGYWKEAYEILASLDS